MISASASAMSRFAAFSSIDWPLNAASSRISSIPLRRSVIALSFASSFV
jgi:hypothetical protein